MVIISDSFTVAAAAVSDQTATTSSSSSANNININAINNVNNNFNQTIPKSPSFHSGLDLIASPTSSNCFSNFSFNTMPSPSPSSTTFQDQNISYQVRFPYYSKTLQFLKFHSFFFLFLQKKF